MRSGPELWEERGRSHAGGIYLSSQLNTVNTMKQTTISVTYSCKFNDPQKRYMNHNFGAEATAALEPGDDPATVRAALSAELETFVHSRRTAIYQAAELEKAFEDQKREFKYAVDEVRRYEEGTRQAKDKAIKANRLYEELESTRSQLGKLGVSVDLPKPFIDVTAPPALAATTHADPEEEGNDPDEETDSQAGLDD